MTAFPGAVLGIIFSFALVIVNCALVRFSKRGVRISAKNFLRASIVATLLLSTVLLILDEGLKSGAWIIFFFIGFHLIILITSYFFTDASEVERFD